MDCKCVFCRNWTTFNHRYYVSLDDVCGGNFCERCCKVYSRFLSDDYDPNLPELVSKKLVDVLIELNVDPTICSKTPEEIAEEIKDAHTRGNLLPVSKFKGED